MAAGPRPGPEAFRPAGKSAKEFLDRVGDELRRADEVLLKLKRGQQGRATASLPQYDAPNADEFLRQLDRAALRLKPVPVPEPASKIPAQRAGELFVEHNPRLSWREDPDARSPPPVASALSWTAIPVAPRGCSAVDEDLSSLLLCEDCRRLGVRLLRVAAAECEDVPPRKLAALDAPPRDVSTMVDRLRDMATAVGEMQAALGGEDRGSRRRQSEGAPRLGLARFSEA